MTKNIWLAIVMSALWSTTSFAQAPSKAAEPAKAAGDPTRELSRAEFDALLKHPENLLIIDVRRPDELTSIGGFNVYLSIQPADVEKNLAAIPRERTIVAVSNHANRAIRVVKILAEHGFKIAGVVGAQNYEEQGGTLTKLAPPPKAAEPAATAGGRQQ